MVRCPACGEAIDQDFGMVTCANCKAVFMINFSGEIAYGQPEEASSVAEKPELSVITGGKNHTEDPEDGLDVSAALSADQLSVDDIPEPDAGLTENSLLYDSEFDDSFSEESSPFSDVDEELIEYSQHKPEAQAELESELVDEDSFDESALLNDASDEPEWSDDHEELVEEPEPLFEDSDQFDGLSAITDETEIEEEEGEQASAPVAAIASEPDPDPVDVTEFADSDESSLDAGSYLYSLRLSRIDSKELKDAVYYTLADEKLGLLYDQLVRGIRHGVLEIPDLHPLKAKRIVEQLQYCDIDILWEQRTVIMGDDDSEEEEPDSDLNL